MYAEGTLEPRLLGNEVPAVSEVLGDNHIHNNDTRRTVKRLSAVATAMGEENGIKVTRGGGHGISDMLPSQHSLPSPSANW